MRVRAIKPGFYGGMRRYPDSKSEMFDLKEEGHFSDVWMVALDEAGNVIKRPRGKMSKVKDKVVEALV